MKHCACTTIVVAFLLAPMSAAQIQVGAANAWGNPDASTPTPALAATPTPSGCPATIQSLVNAAAPGATVTVPACVYRETVTINKPLTLVASPGAEIRGSDIITGWSGAGGVWTKSGLPVFSLDTGACQAGTSRCAWREQVFFDGIPLVQVANNPLVGQFSVDRSTGSYSLADNPQGHTVEVTIRERWVVVSANNITIRGFRMRRAAAFTGQGGINGAVADLTIENNILSDVHGQVISIGGTPTFLSPRIRILNNEIFRGGNTGISLGGASGVNGNFDGSLIQGNSIHDNNTELFDFNWHAGGLKITRAINVTMDNNEVYGNSGPGLWMDVNCTNMVVSNNRIHDNARAGIFFEISQGAQIFGNRSWKNGTLYPGSAYGAGILISSSSNAEVYNNILAWNGNGIIVQSDDRGTWNYLNGFGNYVHDNVIVMVDGSVSVYGLGWLDAWNGTLSSPSSNNRGVLNRYGYQAPEGTYNRFAWGYNPNVNYKLLSAFNATPGEEGGTYLTVSEQNSILTAAGIPTGP